VSAAASRVSVIVPCYNAAAYLAEALRSLLAQVPRPGEVIIIDDGSTDDSGAIAAAWGPPVRCTRQEHQGIAAARNCGLALATGDLIAFLDADDLWPADSLSQRLRRLAEAPELDGVFGLVEVFASPELSPADRRGLQVPAGAVPGRLAGAAVIRREAFERVGGFDTSLSVGETMDWFARAQQQGVALASLDTVVLRRRIHSANTVRKTERLKADYLRVLRASLARRRAAEEGSADPER
jgi:glycosyltransferase involved in cell wall biosynthesis